MLKKQNRLASALTFLFLVSIFLFMSSSSCSPNSNQSGTNQPVNRHWIPSQAYLNGLETLFTQRAQTYAKIQKMYELCSGYYFHGYSYYYTNGASYYAQYVSGYFNAWLERLSTEAESGGNVDLAGDQCVLQEAIQANYSFSSWVDQLDNYFRNRSGAIVQGGGHLAILMPNVGPSPELIQAIAPSVVEGVFSLLKSAASNINQEIQNNAQQDQQMQAKVAQHLRAHEWTPYMYNCQYL